MILTSYLDLIFINSLIMFIGFSLEWLCGWPSRLYALIGHPVSWLGRLIGLLDGLLNRPHYPQMVRYIGGIICLSIVACLAIVIGYGIMAMIEKTEIAIILAGIASFPMLASRSLAQHVKAVATPLQDDDIEAARQAVSMIVGRDVSSSDAPAISRAAIESLAENTSDGIIAPLFWGVLAGLPGLYGYKAINTLDSMIGYKNERYAAFGWASARCDDLVNLLPARLAGLLFCLTVSNPAKPIMLMWREAGKHRSPNAGWPESALAASLDIQLSGPRSYHGRKVDEAVINPAGRIATPQDLSAALVSYHKVMIWVGFLLISIAFGRFLI